MTHSQLITLAKRLLVFAAACVVGGCGSGGPVGEDRKPDEKHITRIASLYTDFKSTHKGRPPRDTEELKNWVKGLKKEQLAARNITDLDTVFVSPRDNQPYVIAKPPPPPKRMGPGGGPPAMGAVIVYEKTGVNGKHMAANGMGYAYELSPEDFKQQVPDAQ
jgi:hypothetical protein